MKRTFLIIVIAALCAACSTTPAANDPAARKMRDAYTAAVNSNSLDQQLGVLEDDVVYLAPNEPVMVGKVAVRPWLERYLRTYKTHWDMPVQEFIVNGEWAFERYSYTSTDTPLAGGPVVTDTGWGLVIYHRAADGKWRVARDAWGSDHPAPVPVVEPAPTKPVRKAPVTRKAPAPRRRAAVSPRD